MLQKSSTTIADKIEAKNVVSFKGAKTLTKTVI